MCRCSWYLFFPVLFLVMMWTPVSQSMYVNSPVPQPERLLQMLRWRRRLRLQSRQLWLLIDRLSPEPLDRSPGDRAESASFKNMRLVFLLKRKMKPGPVEKKKKKHLCRHFTFLVLTPQLYSVAFIEKLLSFAKLLSMSNCLSGANICLMCFPWHLGVISGIQINWYKSAWCEHG